MKSTRPHIAVVGVACRYPDADNHHQLWENILARRRSFRKMPAERLGTAYFSEDGNPDTVYVNKAAVLRDYHFNREQFNISGPSFRTADMAHWLALDVAGDALKDAGFEVAKGLPLDQTGVFIGNTLTGEFSRANLTRLRWPYVAKTLYHQLSEEGWEKLQIEKFLATYERTYKQPFPEMQEDSLAGGLSNTIAGRICNYFDFKGGGYTVDGACSSSLLAVENACSAISNGDLEAALVGGVDLSLDPFELVGFSRAGALARRNMLVYDEHSAGFWPGEGCGFVVLMHLQNAIDSGREIYAVIKGWGISSDGMGGLTRPVMEGQLLAMDRAYQRAGYDMSSLAYVEGHGTGTKVGDETELNTIANQVGKGGKVFQPIAVGSIKANIGHTKAAAGMAGLIKSILVLQNQVIPPASGVMKPHMVFRKNQHLSLPKTATIWKAEQPMRVGVSAMGFGGINAHVTLEQSFVNKRTQLSPKELRLLSAYQDTELFLFRAGTLEDLRKQIQKISDYANRLSFSELTDLSCTLFSELKTGSYRAAIVSDDPEKLHNQLEKLLAILQNGQRMVEDQKSGIYFSSEKQDTRIGFLFPGQGSQLSSDGGSYSIRFPFLQSLLNNPGVGNSELPVPTSVVQPAMVRTSIAALRLMEQLEIKGQGAVGHSLGELSALFHAGCISERDVIDLATERGRLMQELGQTGGGMMSISRAADEVYTYLQGTSLVISGYSSADKTVVSGNLDELNALRLVLKDKGVPNLLLKVSHAFHSPLMAAVQPPLAKYLKTLDIRHSAASFVSTVLGRTVTDADDLKDLLTDQVTNPVRFTEAIFALEQSVDLWVELGCGRTLGEMTKELSTHPVYSTEVGSNSINGLLNLVGALYMKGAELNLDVLFKNRFHRPFDLDWQPTFLANPCELTGDLTLNDLPISTLHLQDTHNNSNTTLPDKPGTVNIEKRFREIVARKLELSLDSVQPESKMLDDLHLNSITVGQLIAETAIVLKIPMTHAPTEYANACVSEIASMLEQLKLEKALVPTEQKGLPEGISVWVRPFQLKWKEQSISPETSSVKLQKNNDWSCTMSGSNEEFKNYSNHIHNLPGDGVLVGLFSDDAQKNLEVLLRSIAVSLKQASNSYFVVLQSEAVAGGFAKSYQLEYIDKQVMVIQREKLPQSVTWLINEMQCKRGFIDVRYDDSESRYTHQLEAISYEAARSDWSLNATDVAAIIGGGKGITLECGIQLATETGVKLGIIGRSDPNTDQVLGVNLDRLKEEGINYCYVMADVGDEMQIQKAMNEITNQLGEVTCILHGAGKNSPVSIGNLNLAQAESTLSPKLIGLRNVLKSIQRDQLKLLVTFGSIIARSGMKGNADYAFANESMANEVLHWKMTAPDCICINMEWSVWSGTGMGDELGVLEQLMQQGIQPISVDKGVAMFSQLLGCVLPETNVVIAGRIAQLPTLSLEERTIPLLRFLEKVVIHHPGIELISEAKLSRATDPYLSDHEIGGNAVFPAVMGLEAMAQVAAVLHGEVSQNLSFKQLEFLNPIVISDQEDTMIRIIGQRNQNGEMVLAIRSGTSQFQQDHFRGICSFVPQEFTPLECPYTNGHIVDLSPSEDLYGNILFHKGRFQRIEKYKILSPYMSVSVARSKKDIQWFGDYLPGQLLNGDPALRDAALHAVQACVPQLTLLPVSVERVISKTAIDHTQVELFAKEVKQEGDLYTYDICIYDKDRNPIEFWEGAVFKALKKPKGFRFNIALTKVILRRKLDEIDKRDLKLSIREQRANSQMKSVIKRPDGKPLKQGRIHISRSKNQGLLMEVRDEYPVGCDIQEVKYNEGDVWRMMLGENRYELARSVHLKTGEDIQISCTRIWGVVECLKKAGEDLASPLTFEQDPDGRMVKFRSGKMEMFSFYTELREVGNPLVISLLMHHKSTYREQFKVKEQLR